MIFTRRRQDPLNTTARNQRERAQGQRLRCYRPSLEALEDRTLLSGLDFGDLATRLSQTAGTIASSIHNAIAAADSIPFIGKELQTVDELTAPLGKVAANLSTLRDTSQIQGALTSALGSLLGGPVLVTPNGSAVTVQALLHQTLVQQNVGNDALGGVNKFDLGLGSFLNVQGNGNIKVMVGFDYLLQFTYVNDQSLALGDPQGRLANLPGMPVPLALNVSATLSGTVNATLNGLLQASATDMGGSNLHGYVGLALTSGGSVTNVVVGGGAVANLLLSLQFARDAGLPLNPQLSAEFHVDWSFSTADADRSSSSFGTLNKLEFDHVKIDIGSFLKPIIGDVQKFTMPMQPIVDFTNLQVPILDDFGVHKTIGELLQDTGEISPGFAGALSAINTINHINVNGDAVIDLGSFNLKLDSNARLAGFLQNGLADIAKSAPTPNLVQQVNAATGGILDQLQSEQSYGLKFPILDDPVSTAFQMLMGNAENVQLFTYRMPTFDVPFEAGAGVDIGILALSLIGKINVKIDLSVGYDLTGLKQAAADIPDHPGAVLKDILSGFYIDNTRSYPTDDNGQTYTHYATGIDIMGDLTATASILVANIKGIIHGQISLHLNKNEDRVRLNELWDSFTSDPLHTFALSGQVYAQADFSVGLDTPFGIL